MRERERESAVRGRGGGRNVEWEDWVRGPRYGHRMEVGSPPSIFLLLVLSRERYSPRRRKMRGTRGIPR